VLEITDAARRAHDFVFLSVGISTRPYVARLHIRCTFPEQAVCSFSPVHSPPATCFWRICFVGAEVLIGRFGKALPTEDDMNGKGVIDRRESLFLFSLLLA